jgi:uncharacterized protein (TIGR03067 family)
MTCWLVSTVLVGLIAAPFAEASPPQKKARKSAAAAEMEKLEGNWKMIRSEHKGNLGAGLEITKPGLFIEDGKIFWTTDGREAGGQRGDITIDLTTNPKSIDVEVTRGSSIGKKLLAIYEFKDQRLTICWSEPGAEKRPTKFTTKTTKGAGETLQSFESEDIEEEIKPAARTTSATKSRKRAGKVDAAAEMKTLEGNWKLTRKEYKGNLWPGVDRGKEGLFIDDGKIFWTRDGKEAGGQRGNITIDPGSSPKTVDVEVTRGSSIGKTLLGVYELKDNKLTISWSEPGAEKRPTKFVTKMAKGAGATLETYEKVEE